MNEEDKIIRMEYILNNTKRRLEVSTELVLRKEIWVVAFCGYVNFLRHFENRYLLLNKGFKCSHKLEYEDTSFLSKRRKAITQPKGATTQKNSFVNPTARIQIR